MYSNKQLQLRPGLTVLALLVIILLVALAAHGVEPLSVKDIQIKLPDKPLRVGQIEVLPLQYPDGTTDEQVQDLESRSRLEIRSLDVDELQVFVDPVQSGWSGKYYLLVNSNTAGAVCLTFASTQPNQPKPDLYGCFLRFGEGSVNPPPPPPTQGDLAVVLVGEKMTATEQQTAAKIALVKYQLDHPTKVWFRAVDPTPKDAAGNVPKWFPPIADATKEKTLPVLVVCSRDSKTETLVVVAVEAVPETAVAVVELLDKYRKR